jgi:hypothetical protein
MKTIALHGPVCGELNYCLDELREQRKIDDAKERMKATEALLVVASSAAGSARRRPSACRP